MVYDAPARPTENTLRRVVGMRAGSMTPYRVLLTLVPPRPSTRGEWARASLERAGIPTFAASFPRAVAFQDAALFGGLAYDEPRGMPAWIAYRDAAKEAMKHAET